MATGKGSSAFFHNSTACPDSRAVHVPSLYPQLSREHLKGRSLHLISGVVQLNIKEKGSVFYMVTISVTYPCPAMRAFLGKKWEETFWSVDLNYPKHLSFYHQRVSIPVQTQKRMMLGKFREICGKRRKARPGQAGSRVALHWPTTSVTDSVVCQLPAKRAVSHHANVTAPECRQAGPSCGRASA